MQSTLNSHIAAELQTKPQAFLKQYRINRSCDFKLIFHSGKKLKTRYFAFHIRPNQLKYPRLGLVVAKKSVAKAVKRNLIKRVIRESFRIHQHVLIGFDILVVAYQSLNFIEKTQMRFFLDKQWENLVLFWEKS